MNKPITLCDIDGTLITKPDDGSIDFHNTNVIYNKHVIDALNVMRLSSEIVFFTKRHIKYELETRKIIEYMYRGPYRLVMRKDETFGDTTAVVKFNMYINMIHNHVLLYIEDDITTINLFNTLGINTIHPNDLPTTYELYVDTTDSDGLDILTELVGYDRRNK